MSYDDDDDSYITAYAAVEGLKITVHLGLADLGLVAKGATVTVTNVDADQPGKIYSVTVEP